MSWKMYVKCVFSLYLLTHTQKLLICFCSNQLLQNWAKTLVSTQFLSEFP